MTITINSTDKFERIKMHLNKGISKDTHWIQMDINNVELTIFTKTSEQALKLEEAFKFLLENKENV